MGILLLMMLNYYCYECTIYIIIHEFFKGFWNGYYANRLLSFKTHFNTFFFIFKIEILDIWYLFKAGTLVRGDYPAAIAMSI